jgi:hypothetical protein
VPEILLRETPLFAAVLVSCLCCCSETTRPLPIPALTQERRLDRTVTLMKTGITLPNLLKKLSTHSVLLTAVSNCRELIF